MRYQDSRAWAAHRIECIVLALLLAFLPALVSPAVLQGRVVKVVDGDTIYVLDITKTQHKIRLAGIDAPEKGQAFGNASHKHLASLVAGREVTVEYDKRDRYGRVVGKVLVDRRDVCLEQVKAGYAWHFKRYQHEQSAEDQRLYTWAEENARADRLGLWEDKNPIPPWEWRRTRR